jgi:hypothetical protein
VKRWREKQGFDFYGLTWSKQGRALGGCLGAKSRRRAWMAARSLGELSSSGDPGMPEWGNPPRGMPGHPSAEHIGWRRGTEGTETSQYLQEERRFPE